MNRLRKEIERLNGILQSTNEILVLIDKAIFNLNKYLNKSCLQGGKWKGESHELCSNTIQLKETPKDPEAQHSKIVCTVEKK